MADESHGPAGVSGAAILDEAERAFDRGDWRMARHIARRELDSSDENRRAAARQMLDRFRPDRQVVVMYLAAVVFFVLAIWGYVVRR